MIQALVSAWTGLGRRVVRPRVPEILQFESTECGTCCLAMVLAHFGRWEPMERMRQLCGSSRDGISAGALVRAAQALNLKAKGFGAPPADLANLPMPQILFWNFNHFLVLERMSGDWAEVVDPAVGRRRLHRSELEAGYCGVTLCMAPDTDFEPAGVPPSALQEVARAAQGAGLAIGVISLVSFGMALLMALAPALTSIFIDYVLMRKGVDAWRLWFMVGVGAFGLVVGPVLWMQRSGILRLQTRLALTLATRIVTQLFQVPLDYFARRFSGEIGGRVMLADTVAGTVSGALVGMISASIQVVVLAAAMLAYHVGLTLLTLALLLTHACLAAWVMRRTRGLVRLLAMERGRYESQVVNALGLVEHSRAAGSDAAMLQRVLERYVAVANVEQRNAPDAALLGSLPGATTGILMAVITGLSAYLVIQGDFSIGVFVAYNAMAYLLLAPFNQLISGQMQVSNASGGFDRVNDLLQVAPQVPVPETAAVPASWDLHVEIASQAYSGLTVLRDVALRVPEGCFLGLVGSVGSGKSTLVNLMAGITSPTVGQVRVGGLPLAQLGQDLRSHAIALVPQTDHLVEGTVMDNVTLWDPNLSEQDVTEACRLCLIHDDIVRRPGAYRSRLREGGTDLSGGQRQRIALARAVVRRPRILLLDEATSALDGRTEAALLKNLRDLGITLIFATHRVAALRGADHLVVMDAGQVREAGAPEDLLAAGGLYARLVAASAKGAT